MPLPDPFDIVAGNPSYVRQEVIPGALLAEYRSRYSTIYDRIDLYMPFIDRSLGSLVKGGAVLALAPAFSPRPWLAAPRRTPPA